MPKTGFRGERNRSL